MSVTSTSFKVNGSNPSGEECAFIYTQASEVVRNYYQATFQGKLKLTTDITLEDTQLLQEGLIAASVAALALIPEFPLEAIELTAISSTCLYIAADLLTDNNQPSFNPWMKIQLTFLGIIPLTAAPASSGGGSTAVMMSNGTPIILSTDSSQITSPIISSTLYTSLTNQLTKLGVSANLYPELIPFILKTPPAPEYTATSQEPTTAMTYTTLNKPSPPPIYATIYGSDYDTNATAFSTLPTNDVSGDISLPVKTIGGVISYTTTGKWCYFQVSNPTGKMVFNITMAGGGGASKGSSTDDECGVGGGGGGECVSFNSTIPTGSYYIRVGDGATDDEEITDPITGNKSYNGGNTYFAYINGNNAYTPLFTAKGGYSKESSKTGGGYGYDSDGNLETEANKGFSYGGDGGASADSGRVGSHGGESNLANLVIKSSSMEQTVNIYAGGGGGGGGACYNGQSSSCDYGTRGAGAGGDGGGYDHNATGYDGKSTVSSSGGNGTPYATEIYGGGGGGGAEFNYNTVGSDDTYGAGNGSRGMCVITWGSDLEYTNDGTEIYPDMKQITIAQNGILYLPYDYTGEIDVEITEQWVPTWAQGIIAQFDEIAGYSSILDFLHGKIPTTLYNKLDDIVTTKNNLNTGPVNLIDGSGSGKLPGIALPFNYNQNASLFYINTNLNWDIVFTSENSPNTVTTDGVLHYNPLDIIFSQNTVLSLTQQLNPVSPDTWLQIDLTIDTTVSDYNTNSPPENDAALAYKLTIPTSTCFCSLTNLIPYVPE
jgi:hypothetical protein